LKFGHRGANQPVKDLESGKVEITAQNHVLPWTRNRCRQRRGEPYQFERQTVEGLRHKTKPVFACNIIPKRRPGRTIRRRCSPNSAR